MNKILQDRLDWFEKEVKNMGLDCFPISWEIVPEDVLLEIMTYSLPTRSRHWHYGQSYEYQKASNEMGLSKVYELILNSDPSYAFLLDTNSDIANTLVLAHCLHPDTTIVTKQGIKKICNVSEQDYVLTHTGSFKKVKWCKETKKTTDFMEIKLNNFTDSILCTPEHKFYVNTKVGPSWVEAKNIKVTDKFINPKSWSSFEYHNSYILSGFEYIRNIQSNEQIAVWDMEVEDDHSFMLESGIIAHNCFGHSLVFKQNYLFKDSDRKMVYHAAERAQRVDEYIEKYGIERVEYIMDVGFALEKHIDWNKGQYREKYGETKKVLKKRKVVEFDDMLGKSKEPMYKTFIENRAFPPNPEKDILWFLINYSTKLEEWEKDILEIIRAESFYFYPQYYTKIIHEGAASWMHAELMCLIPKDLLPEEDYLEFVKIHEKVVQPGSSKLNINPYFLGFTIFNDIIKRWDYKYANNESDINGFQKFVHVIKNEDDISFIRNYLTQDIVDKLKLFAYVVKYDKSREEYIEVESTRVDDVVEHLISEMYDYRAPVIEIVHASESGLELEHKSTNHGTLDLKHTQKVLQYLHDVWGGVIDIKTIDDKGAITHLTYDEMGFSHTDKDDTVIPL
jgi:stage V sporulation protein R